MLDLLPAVDVTIKASDGPFISRQEDQLVRLLQALIATVKDRDQVSLLGIKILLQKSYIKNVLIYTHIVLHVPTYFITPAGIVTLVLIMKDRDTCAGREKCRDNVTCTDIDTYNILM